MMSVTSKAIAFPVRSACKTASLAAILVKTLKVQSFSTNSSNAGMLFGCLALSLSSACYVSLMFDGR
jgi:hypothetical protein